MERPDAHLKASLARIVYDAEHVDAYQGCINGLVIVPDDWQCPPGCTFIASNKGADAALTSKNGFATNSYDMFTSWPLMEASGAVFLPITGYRNGATGFPSGSSWIVWGDVVIPPNFLNPYLIYPNGQYAYYWTSTIANASGQIGGAHQMAFGQSSIFSTKEGSYRGKEIGQSVRLVHSANQTP